MPKAEASTMEVAETPDTAGIARWSEIDYRLMRRALELAAEGRGQVSPGPMVGCVIARDGGEIIGEGFYVYERVIHAEAIALAEAGERACGATAYVSLEPHSHHGRTPPCTDALIRAGIRRVVAPIEDPNPLVSGKGFRDLEAAGVEVSRGLLADEAAQLLESYIHSIKHARPFVHLKLACSLDGRIATRTGDSRWITGAQARERVHQMRYEHDAILVGAGTVAADDPALTDRSGLPRHRPLVRVVLDDRLTLSPDSTLALTTADAPVIAFAREPETPAAEARAGELKARGVQIIFVKTGATENKRDLKPVLRHLHQLSLRSVLVEGGANVAGAFLDARLIDKASFFIAPIIIGGTDAPPAIGGNGASRLAAALRLTRVQHIAHGDDLEITGYSKGRVMSTE